MQGWSSDRKDRLPKNWGAIRRSVLQRDGYRCTARRVDTQTRCDEKATDVHHIINNDNNAMANLTSLCRHHHLIETHREAKNAKDKYRKIRRYKHIGYTDAKIT